MKNFNILGVHWKLRLLGGFSKNQYRRRDWLKMGARTVCWFKEVLDKKEGVVFLREGWYAYAHHRVEVCHAKASSCHVRGYWLCARGDLKFLICHVTLQSNVIEGSCNFTSGDSLHFTTLPSLVAIGVVIVYIFVLSRDLERSRY